MYSPEISVVIPAYNEEEDIGNLLDSLMKVNYPKNKMDIIVVNDGSTDRTAEIVKKYPVKLLKGPHKGCGNAKNIGWRAGKGEIIIFFDADMIVHPDYIKDTVKLFEDPKMGAATHIELLGNKKHSFVSRMLYIRKFVDHGKSYKPLHMKSIRRSVMEEIGGYDLRYGYFDDWYIGTRIEELGYKNACTEGKIWHKEIDNFKDLLRQCKWTGRSLHFQTYKIRYARKFIYWMLCALLPVFIIISFIGFPFSVLGLLGILAFAAIELKRTIKIYIISGKDSYSFFTPMFDYITMNFQLLGFLEKIFLKAGAMR